MFVLFKMAIKCSTYDIDAYFEYRKIVGDDDNGKLMSPTEFEAYKKKVLPKRLKNRLYVSWTNEDDMDCKLIGPETLCFCGHRYKNHDTDFDLLPKDRPVRLRCKQSGCKCQSYNYVPTNGGQSIRCTCKHFSHEHRELDDHNCAKKECKCASFKSSFPCGCMQPYSLHRTIVETKEERVARGKPVGMDVPYQAMGGITGYSSLIDGYMRLDPSGQGAPTDDLLDKKITEKDHPFLRSHALPRAPARRTKSVEPKKKAVHRN